MIMLLACASEAFSQNNPPPVQPPQEEFTTDSDPTRPVAFSIRPEFYSVAEGASQSVLIFRSDRAVLSGRRVPGARTGFLLRFEAPLAASRINGVTHAGLGDMYAQVLVLPYISRKFAFGVGSGVVLPTATYQTLGRGKWTVAPVAAPVWFIPRRGMFFVKFQNFLSVAGDAQRPNINYFLFTPTLIYRVTPRWWIIADTETKTNWLIDGRTGVKSGFQLGHVFTRGFGAWVKPEVWWGPNRDGRWNLKIGLVWYGRR